MATAATKRASSSATDAELWENTTAGRVCLKFYNQQGMLTDRLIDSFRKFTITTKERQLNQEMAAGPDLDHFSNGIFAPVRLVETADDIEKIKSNPNLVTEDDMKGLLANKTAKAFQERVDAISNPFALTRMLELAREDDSTTAKQVKAIEDRLRDVSPSTYQEVTSVRPEQQTPQRPARFKDAVTTADLAQ